MRTLLIAFLICIAAAAPATAQDKKASLKELTDVTEHLRGIITQDHQEFISLCRDEWDVTVKTGARPSAPCRTADALEARNRARVVRFCDETLRNAEALASPASSITKAQVGSIAWALDKDIPWCVRQGRYYGWGEK